MIFAALNDKARSRGPLGFVADIFELGLAIGVLTAGTFAGALVILPVLVLEYVAEGRRAARAHRCDADCAAGRTVCRAEEPS